MSYSVQNSSVYNTNPQSFLSTTSYTASNFCSDGNQQALSSNAPWATYTTNNLAQISNTDTYNNTYICNTIGVNPNSALNVNAKASSTSNFADSFNYKYIPYTVNNNYNSNENVQKITTTIVPAYNYNDPSSYIRTNITNNYANNNNTTVAYSRELGINTPSASADQTSNSYSSGTFNLSSNTNTNGTASSTAKYNTGYTYTPFDAKSNDNTKLVYGTNTNTNVSTNYMKNQNARAISSSKLSICSQLHRSNFKIPTQLIAQNSIYIENKSTMDLLIRLSGSPEHAGKEFYSELSRKAMKLFDRSSNSIYKLHITNSQNLKGTVFNVKSGCAYIIDENFNLVDPAGNMIISSSTDYNKLFEWKDAFTVFYDKCDNRFTNSLTHDSILVANKTADGLIIRLLGENSNKYEDCVEIDSLVCLNYSRKPGKYIATVTKHGEEVSNKYELENGNCYVWDAISGLVNYSRNSAKVDQYIFRANEPNKINYYKNTNTNLTDSNGIFSVSQNWIKLRRFIKDSNNKSKITDFSQLLFRSIEITNSTNFAIHVRIISKRIGSEDFMKIKPKETLKWKRFDGEYLTEVILPNLKSKRFYLTSDCKYAFTVNAQMLNIDNISSKHTEVLNVKDCFGGDELIYYDESTSKYLRQKIDYSDEAATNKSSINNFTSKKSNLINNESRDNTVYEYYNDIEPDYSPGKPFTDKSFPPNKSSLTAIDPLTGLRRKPHFQHQATSLTPQEINSYKFKRPKDIFKGKYYLYKDDICVEDVNQGQLGDCFLMSVLASISQRPDLIKAIFKTTTVNPDGFYELFYWENGKKKIMFVDDHFVTDGEEAYKSVESEEIDGNDNEQGVFPFAQPNGQELWVMLIEKAYAKYEGGFSNIIGGVMSTELTWLTGAMSRYMKTSNMNCWAEIINAIKAGFIITSASQAGTGNHFNQSDRGISNGHAYSILDANEYRDGTKNLRIVKLRNPWGNTEWTGDYSDNSPKWTPELKKFFKVEESKDNGVFFMTFEDYKTEFANVVICCIESRR